MSASKAEQASMKKAQRAYAANKDQSLVPPPAICNSSVVEIYQPRPWLSARTGADDNQRYHSVGNRPQITKVES